MCLIAHNNARYHQALRLYIHTLIKVLLFSFAIAVIDYKFLLLALLYVVPPTNTVLNWIEENTKVGPFLSGFLVSFFSCVMIYLGYHVRFDIPPLFRRGGVEGPWDQRLDYLGAILAGITIRFLMYVFI